MKTDAVKEYAELFKQVKELTAQLKDLKAKKDDVEREVREMLDTDDIDKVTVDGATVYRRDDVFASIPKDDSREAFEWLINHDGEDLIETTVNARKLTAWVKEQMEDIPNIEEIAPFNIVTKKRVGIRL